MSSGTSKEYISALNSFTYALDQVVKTLQDKEKASDGDGSDVMEEFFTSSKGHFELVEAMAEDINEIRNDVKSSNAKSDEILKAVKAIKSKKDKGIFDTIEKDSNKDSIVDGVKTIILIAAGVLAIGMAFKVIGSVDFMSVLALSIALPLIAYAFVLISEMGDLDYNTVSSIAEILVIMSIAVMLSSHVLSMSAKLSPAVVLTALAIALIFTVVSLAVSVMIDSMDGAGLKEVLLLGLVMVVVSLAIMVSSMILQYTVPIPLWDVILASIAIAVVSIVIAVTLWVINKLLTIKDAIIGSLILVVISAAVMVASHILALGDYSNAPDVDWALGVGLTMLMLSPVILLLGVPALALFFLIGSLMLIVVSTSIMVVSHILALGDYENYPSLGWVAGVGLTMLSFAPMTLALGFMGLLFPIIILGISVMLMIAQTIVDVSNILSEGNYGNVGSMIGWALSTVLLFTAFAPMMLLLGGIAMLSSIFGGSNPMEEGRSMLKTIAHTIVDISNILSEGNYSGGPGEEWAKGTGFALVSFMNALQMVSPSAMDWWIGGGTSIEDKVNNLKHAVFAMVEIAKYLGEVTGSGVFDPSKAPPKEWAEGVGSALVSFMEALNSANDKSMWDSMGDFFGGGDSLGDKMNVLYRVVDTMVNIAWYLNSKSVAFKKGPSKSWAEGVGGSITAFSEALAIVSKGDILENFDQSKNAIRSIAGLMVDVGTILSSSSDVFKTGPSKSWSKGVEQAYKSFYYISKYVENSNVDASKAGMIEIAKTYLEVGDIFNKIKTNDDPFLRASKGINALADAFRNFGGSIRGMSTDLVSMSYDSINMIKTISMSILALSSIDSDNLENVLSKLKPEDIAKMYNMAGEQANKSSSRTNVSSSNSGAGPIKTFASNLMKASRSQTKELINIKNELIKMNLSVSKIATNTDEMLDVKSTNNDTSITH